MSEKLLHVTHAEHVRDHQIRLRFTDGVRKTVDFSQWLHGEIFRRLADEHEFKRFFLAGGTVCWPNGADIAPETLHAARNVE